MVKQGSEVVVPEGDTSFQPGSQGAVVAANDAAMGFMRRIARNLGTDARIGMNLFPTIRIPGSGGKFWEVLDADGNPSPSATIEGVISYWHPSRAYWVVPYNQRTADTQKTPDCRSIDARKGIGNPGISCAECPFAQWASGPNGVGSACNQMRNVYILRDGMYVPNRLILPVTSIKAFTSFMGMLTGLNKDYEDVRVSVGLEQDKSTGGDIVYSKVTFRSLGNSSDDERASARRFGQAIDVLIHDPGALEEFVAA